VLLTAGYEGVRQATRRYEAAHALRLNAFSTTTATVGKYSVFSELLACIYGGMVCWWTLPSITWTFVH
jgi:hypothetical protein